MRPAPARAWVSIAACLAIAALQTVCLFGLALRIPTLELSLFVWRLAFPAAFLGFGALLAGWREASWPARRGLVPLAILSTACMMLVVFDIEPLHIATPSKGMDDHRTLVDYDRGEGIWGVHEFFPNYAKTPRVCDDAPGEKKATFDELRAGLKALARSSSRAAPRRAWSTIASTAPHYSPAGARPTWCWGRCHRARW
jgi:hypothetical protein